MPRWGNTELLGSIDFKDIHYYLKSTEKQSGNWDDVPEDIKRTYDRLGFPKRNKNSSVEYPLSMNPRSSIIPFGKIWKPRELFSWTWIQHFASGPDIVKKYFSTVIPMADNKFAALNSAVWSGGSFIYVPPGVDVGIPLQAYFRINAENMGQFERTLIIADKGSRVHYIEGCTAPVYSTNSLHSAVVELIAMMGLIFDIPQSKTGRTTSSIWSPKERSPTKTQPWNGWMGISAPN